MIGAAVAMAGLALLMALLPGSAQAGPHDDVFFSEWSHGPTPPRTDLGQWVISCRRDSFTDEKICTIKATPREQRSGDLVVILSGKGAASIAVGGGPHQPGSTVAVRIDETPAVSWPAGTALSSKQADELVGQMRRGTAVRSRWFPFPRSTPLDQQVSLQGLGPAIDRARAVLSGNYGYDASEAASAAFWLTIDTAPHLADTRICDPAHARSVEQRIAGALHDKPAALASHLRSKKSVMVGAELLARQKGVGGIDCPAAKLDLDRMAGRLLTEAAHFR